MSCLAGKQRAFTSCQKQVTELNVNHPYTHSLRWRSNHQNTRSNHLCLHPPLCDPTIFDSRISYETISMSSKFKKKTKYNSSNHHSITFLISDGSLAHFYPILL